MEMLVSRRRFLTLASVMLALGMALALLPSQPASGAEQDCRLSVSGPFFYAGMVFPVIEVSCDTVKQSIRIDAALDMDGSQVATASRTCRRTDTCWTGLARDGIFAQDVPGDQLWCGTGSASIQSKGPNFRLHATTSCESESF